MDLHGNWVTDQHSINGIFLQYFQMLLYSLGTNINVDLSYDIRGRVTEDVNSLLCQSFSLNDVKNSVFQIHPSKAPSFDGLPAVFFQNYWPVIGDKLTATSLRILNDGGDLGDINHTLIVFVPKIKEPSHISEFWPISLCFVCCKIISKMIVNRLKILLLDIISEE